MKINGRGLGDHLHLITPLCGLIAAVWALRMILAAAGVPLGLVKVFSVTVATPFTVLVAVMLIYVRRFGSYTNVALVAFLLSGWAQLLVVAAIAFTALTQRQNIYTAPEFSMNQFSLTQHILGHLTFGIGFGTIFGTLMGWLLLWMLRQLPGEISSQKK